MTKKILIKSSVIALVFGLILPFIWLFFNIPTHQTIPLDGPEFENMSRTEISEWITKNVPPPTAWEHCKYLAKSDLWRSGYIKLFIIVFIFVFFFLVIIGLFLKKSP